MKKRIIVTGSNGLLGQKVINLLTQNETVFCVATAKGANRHISTANYLYEEADICDAERWKVLFETHRPTALIHTAAMTQVDVCEDEKEACDKINVEAVAMLCDLCEKYNTHLVHISTDFIFDGEKGLYVEDDVAEPVNYYGLSKLKAEQVIAKSKASSAVLRTILLYGYVPELSRTNIVLWVKNSLEQGKNIKVVNDQERCPTLVEDLAQASVSAALKQAKGIFHICGPERMNVLELAKRVARFWKLDESLIGETDSQTLNQRAKRPPRTAFLIEKAQKELDYQPHSLEEGFALLDKQLK
ncbi:MAG: SDR family oxidoreductase [Bacteroidia bacterium]